MENFDDVRIGEYYIEEFEFVTQYKGVEDVVCLSGRYLDDAGNALEKVDGAISGSCMYGEL